jgi:hypothetical protein
MAYHLATRPYQHFIDNACGGRGTPSNQYQRVVASDDPPRKYGQAPGRSTEVIPRCLP